MPETVLVNGNAYSLLKLLGKGKGGYSYLAQMADGQQVVVKQIHHEPCVYYQFGSRTAGLQPPAGDRHSDAAYAGC